MTQKLEEIRAQAVSAFQGATSSKELYDLKVQFLGKQGSFSTIMKEMGKLSAEEKPVFGKLVNEVKQALESVYSEKEESLRQAELQAKLQSESLDLTLPAPVE